MTEQEIQKKLEERFGAAVGPVAEGAGDSWIEVDADRIDEVAAFMKSDPDLRFDCLSNQTGLDLPERNHIQVVYRIKRIVYFANDGNNIVNTFLLTVVFQIIESIFVDIVRIHSSFFSDPFRQFKSQIPPAGTTFSNPHARF